MFSCVARGIRGERKMSSHNSKYYVPSLKRNKVKSHDIRGIFSKKSKNVNQANENDESDMLAGDNQASNSQNTDICHDLSTNNQCTNSTQVQSMIEFEPDNGEEDSTGSAQPLTTKLITSIEQKVEQSTIDLRRKQNSSYETQFPDFYFSNSQNGWFCKICPSFAPGSGSRPFIEIAGGFGDHPRRRADLHLNSERHQKAVQNMQTYKVLQKQHTSVHTILTEANLASQIKKTTQNRFVMKSLFRILHFLLLKNWAYTHNYKDLVELIGQCGGNELRNHLLFGSKNAQYLSPVYVSKFMNIMNDHIEIPLLASLRSGHFTFYNDETQDVTSVEQMAVYGSFQHNGRIAEHYVGIYPISKVVGTSLAAPNVMASLERFFQDRGINFKKARFACMDNTNVNSGERGGLKRYLKNIVPMLIWVGCGNHKLALCFKHLLPLYETILETDTFLESLWKFFKYRPLAMNLLDQCADIYGENVVVPVCPSVTRWTAHERSCKAVIEGYHQFVSSLITCYNERREPEALGLLLQLCKPSIIASILMLLEVFACTGPLNLVLQKGNGSICLSDLPTHIEMTKIQLTKVKSTRTWLKIENLAKFQEIAQREIISLPVASRLRVPEFNFSDFENKVFLPFVDDFISEIEKAFENIQFWKQLSIFDPRKLPSNKIDLISYGGSELDALLNHYGKPQCDTFDGKFVQQAADVDPTRAKEEWQLFKIFMFLKREDYQFSIDKKIKDVKNPASEEGAIEIKELQKIRKSFTPQLFWKKIDDTAMNLYPTMAFFTEILLLFPLSVACVERLFSKMKLIKTRLRNQLSHVHLDQLLRIATESPKEGFTDEIYESFVDELKKRNPKLRIDI